MFKLYNGYTPKCVDKLLIKYYHKSLENARQNFRRGIQQSEEWLSVISCQLSVGSCQNQDFQNNSGTHKRTYKVSTPPVEATLRIATAPIEATKNRKLNGSVSTIDIQI